MRTCHLRRTNRTCRHGSWQRRKTTAVGVKARTCCCLRPALKKLLSDGESSRWRRRRAAPPALDAPAADPPTASMRESSSLLTVLCSSESIGTLQLAHSGDRTTVVGDRDASSQAVPSQAIQGYGYRIRIQNTELRPKYGIRIRNTDTEYGSAPKYRYGYGIRIRNTDLRPKYRYGYGIRIRNTDLRPKYRCGVRHTNTECGAAPKIRM